MDSKYHFKFEDLKVYQKALDFGEIVHVQTKLFPKEGTDAQFVKHINYAIYSANECVSCSTKARYRNYISDIENEENRMCLSELTKMLSSLRRIIEQRIKKSFSS